jgi:cyclophilin family peptidyl-prolyl cis-trans isomerase
MKAILREVFVGCCLAFALNARADAPVITSQPQPITINNASTANFSVVASNAAGYQWMFGGNPIPGATDSTLLLDDVTNSQAGSYNVAVTSPTGDIAISQTVQLTLVPGTIVNLTFSGYADGSQSNVVLQLFDHDKPATVQNFLHYIVSGVFTNNLFWTRLVPGFVLQGGDYVASDRTSGPPPVIYSIYDTYVSPLGYQPPFPFQIDNEFGVGPFIPNTFGTIAMAKSPTSPDSAVNSFFFNLADNSGNLDNQNGGFTVFGRILSGTNVLDYFNTFSTITANDPTGNPNTNGVFQAGGAFTTLPVNYHSLATPGNSNFFYVDFSFPTPPVIDTTPPTVSLTYPANNETVTNAHVIVTGTAADDFGLARVVVTVGGTTTIEATGTTNWSADLGTLQPGTQTLTVVSQDGAGNLSSSLNTSFIVLPYGFSLAVNGSGTITSNIPSTNAIIGGTYTVKAIPAKGWAFRNWTLGPDTFLTATFGFFLPNGGQLVANFVPNNLSGVTFTYPAANAKLTTTNVALNGKIAASAGQTSVTCQIYSQANNAAIAAPVTASGTTTWSIPAAPLTPGNYTVQAVASNAVGKSTVISESFTVLSPIGITISGNGTTSITNGSFLIPGGAYSIKATPKPGSLFYGWQLENGISNNPSFNFKMTNGTTFEAMFISNSIPQTLHITSPAANAVLITNSIVLTGTISSSVSNPQITCQLYQGFAQSGANQAAIINGATWSVPMTNLTQGTYTAVVVASDSQGRQTLVTQNFSVNLYPPIAGTYYGVFIDPNPAADNSGYFALTLNSTGQLTGTLQLPVRTFIISMKLNSAGNTGWLLGPGFNGEIYWQFDLTGGSPIVNDWLYTASGETEFTGYRGVTALPTNTVAGKYVLNLTTLTNLTSTNAVVPAPTNNSYATITITKTGGLALAGVLADSTTFSRSTGISKDGIWPFYAPLYSGGGMLIGWETNVASASGSGSVGNIYWLKPATKSSYYPDAFALLAAAPSTNYIPPANGSQYVVTFAGGSVDSPLSNVLTVKAGKFVPAPGALDKLSITLSASGAITGTIYNPASKKTLPIRGSFSNPSIGGSGFTLDTDGQSDPFQISLMVP